MSEPNKTIDDKFFDGTVEEDVLGGQPRIGGFVREGIVYEPKYGGSPEE